MVIQNLTYNVPFNCPDLVTVDKIMAQIAKEYPDDFNKVFDDMNSICLGIGGVGSYQLITTMPVDEISDLKNVGVSAMAGLKEGINAGRFSVITALKSAVQAAVTAAKQIGRAHV